ncbi:MAG: TIGR00159 family protein [Deltaproteobacteria bacterium]|nr:TIGR00159 family protein [Deltaproteobacteria bacterium]
MIEYLWELWGELWEYLSANYDPLRDTIDILLVALGIYWLLLLMRGTRAVQILVGLIVLVVANVASDLFNLLTMSEILDKLTEPAVIIIVILFQHDIRRALARVGRGFFRSVSDQKESQMLEEVVRAAQGLAQRRVGALIVLERETGLEDQIEAGTALDSNVSKDLLISLFVPYSPLHDGAVVIQRGRISYAGCILPLTLSDRLPEGVGTRHRAAVGITEETDALVIVVSEETASISAVMGGEMVSDLDAARLRVVLRDAMSGAMELHAPEEAATAAAELQPGGDGDARTDLGSVGSDEEAAAEQSANQSQQVRSAG